MAGQSARWITTARVLRRAGFGVTGAQVDAAVGQDWAAYLDAALAANPDADPARSRRPLPTLAPLRPPARAATQAARQQYRRELSGQEAVLCGWWLRRMVAVQQPLHEKLTLLWHNHFATSAQKVRVAAYMAAQNQKLRTLAFGDFRTLAYTMLTDAGDTALAGRPAAIPPRPPTRTWRGSSWSCSRSATAMATPRPTCATAPAR